MVPPPATWWGIKGALVNRSMAAGYWDIKGAQGVIITIMINRSPLDKTFILRLTMFKKCVPSSRLTGRKGCDAARFPWQRSPSTHETLGLWCCNAGPP